MKILLITSNSYPTHKSAISDFWGKEVSDLKDLTLIMKKKLDKGTKLNEEDINKKMVLVPHVIYNNIFLNIFSIILFNVRFFLAIRRYVIRNKIDVIHTYNSSFASLIVSFLDSKSLHSLGWSSDFISMQRYSSNNLGFGYKLINNIRVFIGEVFFLEALKKIDIFCPITKELGDEILENYNLDIETFPINQNATSDFLNYSLSQESNLINRKNFYLVYIGTISERRDIEFLLDVLDLVNKDCRNVKLYIMGWYNKISYRKKIRNYLLSKGLKNKIIFTGMVNYEDLPKWLSKFNLGISHIPPNSFYKVSSPTKVLTYLSLGLPVVCNQEIIDQKNIILNSKAGYSIPYDKNLFAEKIIKLVMNNSMGIGMGNKGRNWVKKNRSYKELATKLVNHYSVKLKNR